MTWNYVFFPVQVLLHIYLNSNMLRCMITCDHVAGFHEAARKRDIYTHKNITRLRLHFLISSVSAIIQQVLFHCKGTSGIKKQLNTKTYCTAGLLESIKLYLYVLLFEILPLYCTFISPIPPQFNTRVWSFFFLQNGKHNVIHIFSNMEQHF